MELVPWWMPILRGWRTSTLTFRCRRTWTRRKTLNFWAEADAVTFKDHFTATAATYAAARPAYPDALYQFVANHAPARGLAWDCATGNGQAARGLARVFARVVATDASAAQLSHAPAVPGVEYRVAPAERSGLPDRAADAITVATALHWFDFDAFFREVRRVLVPGGLIVVWCYGRVRAGDDVDALVHAFQRDVVGAYWPAERRYVDEEYATIPFPFREVPAPALELRESYALDQLLAYLATWSSTARYREATGGDPIPALEERMRAVWGERDTRRDVWWPLHIRVGYVD
jgi:SAM-dependent methyltransferase